MYFFDRFEGLKKTKDESLHDELEFFMETRAFYEWQFGVQTQENLEQKIIKFQPDVQKSHLSIKGARL
jgi:hypothetical protein